MMVGISAFGAYIPRLRLQRASMVQATAWFNPGLSALGRGERAIANWDEDSITMAVEAARDCLNGKDRETLGRLILASTTFPFADRQNSGLVKEALNLPDEVSALDIAGSQRAGTAALLVALESSGNLQTLCVAAERRRARPASDAEFSNGDAAAAVLISEHNVAAEFLGSHSTTVDFVDHFRAVDRAYDYDWESRWIRDEGYLKLLPEAIVAALKKLSLDPADIDHVVVPLPMRGVDKKVAAIAGIRSEAVCDPLTHTLGYAGAAQPLILLASVLEKAKPGAVILVAAFGQGCDVLVFRATEKIGDGVSALGVRGWLARGQAESNYLKHLYFSGEVELHGGIRSELDRKTPPSMLYRERKTVLSLIGGRCRETGTVQFPKARVSISQNARLIDTQDDYPLADLPARVMTFTADHLAFTPDPPAYYGMVEFEGGGRMMADFVDVGSDGVEIGQAVRMVFRLKRSDTRGFKHYFWKAAPQPSSGSTEGTA